MPLNTDEWPGDSFERHEFACKCGCGFDTVDAELLAVLDNVRRVFKSKVLVSSGCRCPAYNKRVGGAPKSRHLEGRAADIVVANAAPALVAEYLKERYLEKYGIGEYHSFTHIDTRAQAVRWKG